MSYNVLGNNGLGVPSNGGKEVKVATYVRVSTVFEEQDSSIINQAEGLIDYIRKNDGWVLYEPYSERESSFKKRAEFKRLVNDAMAKKFDVILVKSLSRFGRSVGELNTIIPKLVEKGIRFIATSEGIDTENFDWQSKIAMYSMVYQMSSQTTSEWVRLAERTRARRGEFTGSFTPYGYQKVDKKLVLADDNTPGIVQRIFDQYQEGILGMQAIANLLNDENIPTPGQTQGRKNASEYWCQSTIEYILRNPVYIGDLVAQKEQAATLGSTRRKKKDKEDQVINENNHSLLISREQFRIVQDLLYRRGRKKTCGMPNLFTHLLYCADCGSGMHCVKRSYGKTHYMCGNYKLRGKNYCSRHSVYESHLEELILSDIRILMGEHIDTKTFTKKLQKESDRGKRSNVKEILNLNKSIEQIVKRKNNAEDKWLDGEMTKEKYHEFLERYDGEIFECRQKIADLSKEEEVSKPKLPDIAKLTSFENLDRELLLMLVKRIEIKEDGDVKIIYNFTV
ncbi:Site-specific DNA recombinase [Paenibacillus sp. 1_12]|uniref:recombinase family protein n=1 Tax=Paenibacillus sp. 1_12 TaxID=1566278 RepID=UPI0008E7D1B5|nr:recombinase family protein [Paenibacillus sp. 1_12]SFM05397.1 Site-specific DNA recombinase [Paenibacillus sp. 1_12]